MLPGYDNLSRSSCTKCGTIYQLGQEGQYYESCRIVVSHAEECGLCCLWAVDVIIGMYSSSSLVGAVEHVESVTCRSCDTSDVLRLCHAVNTHSTTTHTLAIHDLRKLNFGHQYVVFYALSLICHEDLPPLLLSEILKLLGHVKSGWHFLQIP